MKQGDTLIYNNFKIYLNPFGEHCVCRKLTGVMVSYNAGFKTLAKAKQFINKINPEELSKDEIIKIARKINDTR